MTTLSDMEDGAAAARQIEAEAERVIDTLIGGYAFEAPEVVLEGLLEVLPQIYDQFGAAAVTAAAQWYESIHPDENYRAVIDSAPVEQYVEHEKKLREPIMFAANNASEGSFLKELAAASNVMVRRHVSHSFRNAIIKNARRDPSQPRWARVPQGKTTCRFCVMLASRGFDYWTKETAGAMTSRLGDRFHDDCDCLVVPQWGKDSIDGYDPSPYMDLYSRGRKICDLSGEEATTRAVLEGMKLADPDMYTDTNSWKPEHSSDGTLHKQKWNEYRAHVLKSFFETDFPKGTIARVPPVKPASPPVTHIRGAQLTAERWNHILYGNIDGVLRNGQPRVKGAHLSGYGWVAANNPKHTTFPKDWDEFTIIKNIDLALKSQKESGEYEYAGKEGKVIVHLSSDGKMIRTAYFQAQE